MLCYWQDRLELENSLNELTSQSYCYIVHDEHVLDCEYQHRIPLYITLDENNAKQFAESSYTLKIEKVPLDKNIEKLMFGVKYDW